MKAFFKNLFYSYFEHCAEYYDTEYVMTQNVMKK